MDNKELMKMLETRIQYALDSHSITLAYEAHGMIAMARELNAIEANQYLALDHKIVAEGINNPKAELR